MEYIKTHMRTEKYILTEKILTDNKWNSSDAYPQITGLSSSFAVQFLSFHLHILNAEFGRRRLIYSYSWKGPLFSVDWRALSSREKAVLNCELINQVGEIKKKTHNWKKLV